MVSRMDKYQNEPDNSISRIAKNEQLYKELYNNKRYTEFTDIKDNVYEIDPLNNSETNRRSNYNRKTLFNDNDLAPKEEISETMYTLPQEKNYNVNEVLEMARKNRSEMDEEEKKRKIKSVEYSILSDLNEEKLKAYHDKKEKGITKKEEQEIDELIHTITSNSLRKKIDDELLNDLMPDTNEETTVSKQLLEDIKNAESKDEIDNQNDKEDKSLENEIDNSFYTRSMDLRKEDLVFDNEDEEVEKLFEDSNLSVGKKIAIFLLIVIVLSAVGYVIYRFI